MFDLEEVNKQFPTNYNESMNTVFTQEAARYNILLNAMTNDLVKFKDANRGRIVMNEELERMGVSMMNNEVPMQWTEEDGVGFLSIKNLAAWIVDLRKRMAFMKEWQTEGTPKCFWMSGLFEPQAFLTGIKQNYARKYKIGIDLVEFEYIIMNDMMDASELTEPADEGCYINGL